MSSLPLRSGHNDDYALLVGSLHHRRCVSHGILAKNQSACPPPSSPFSYRSTRTGSPVTYSAQSTRPLARYPSGRLHTVVTWRRIMGGEGFFYFSAGPYWLFLNRRFDRVWRRKVRAYSKSSTGCCFKPSNDLFLPIFSLQICSYEAVRRVVNVKSRNLCGKRYTLICSIFRNGFRQ